MANVQISIFWALLQMVKGRKLDYIPYHLKYIRMQIIAEFRNLMICVLLITYNFLLLLFYASQVKLTKAYIITVMLTGLLCLSDTF